MAMLTTARPLGLQVVRAIEFGDEGRLLNAGGDRCKSMLLRLDLRHSAGDRRWAILSRLSYTIRFLSTSTAAKPC